MSNTHQTCHWQLHLFSRAPRGLIITWETSPVTSPVARPHPHIPALSQNGGPLEYINISWMGCKKHIGTVYKSYKSIWIHGGLGHPSDILTSSGSMPCRLCHAPWPSPGDRSDRRPSSLAPRSVAGRRSPTAGPAGGRGAWRPWRRGGERREPGSNMENQLLFSRINTCSQ